MCGLAGVAFNSYSVRSNFTCMVHNDRNDFVFVLHGTHMCLRYCLADHLILVKLIFSQFINWGVFKLLGDT